MPAVSHISGCWRIRNITPEYGKTDGIDQPVKILVGHGIGLDPDLILVPDQIWIWLLSSRDKCNIRKHGSDDLPPSLMTAVHHNSGVSAVWELRRFFRLRLFRMPIGLRIEQLPQLLPNLLKMVSCSYWALTCLAILPPLSACMRFLFVRPEICRRLPSDSPSPGTPLP